MDASFRVIATRAGVSPALITHHFGSKSALRAECDAEVLRRYRLVKSDAIVRPSAHLFEALTGAAGGSATLLVYMLRAILTGGESARTFIEHLIDEARDIMAQAVASGLVRPSRNEEARLRYLTYQTMGALIVQFVTLPGARTAEEFVASVRTEQQDTILPILELFTEGLLTDRRMLDDYVQWDGQSPAAAPDPPPPLESRP